MALRVSGVWMFLPVITIVISLFLLLCIISKPVLACNDDEYTTPAYCVNIFNTTIIHNRTYVFSEQQTYDMTIIDAVLIPLSGLCICLFGRVNKCNP